MDPSFKIEFLPDDHGLVSLVAGWIYQQWHRHRPSWSFEQSYQRVKARAGRTEPPLTVVAFERGLPVGTATISLDDMSSHPELSPWMASLFVLPEQRGRGIGSALVERIHREFDRLGIKTAYLFTPDREAMYRRLGWRPVFSEEFRGELVSVMKIER